MIAHLDVVLVVQGQYILEVRMLVRHHIQRTGAVLLPLVLPEARVITPTHEARPLLLQVILDVRNLGLIEGQLAVAELWPATALVVRP